MINFFTVEASRLYDLVGRQRMMSNIWAMLTRQSQRLLDLETIRHSINVTNRHYIGIQTVPIEQIRGSEGRSREFDVHFRPRQLYTEERWINIAVAQRQGHPLPPVELIRIGDVYFVRDGHHRISVARAMGQEQIEATVTVWETTGTLPWESPVVCNIAGSTLSGAETCVYENCVTC